MAIKLDEILAKLPEQRQQAIKERTVELMAEESTLRQIREARERSQGFSIDTDIPSRP